MAQHPTPVLEALSAGQRAILVRALADALEQRTPSGECADCQTSGTGVCLDHADDFGLCRAYRELGVELGLKAG